MLVAEPLEEAAGAAEHCRADGFERDLLAESRFVVVVDSEGTTLGDQLLLLVHEEQLSAGDLHRRGATSGSTSTDLMKW